MEDDYAQAVRNKIKLNWLYTGNKPAANEVTLRCCGGIGSVRNHRITAQRRTIKHKTTANPRISPLHSNLTRKGLKV